ncbi:MAG: sigma-70 family RNA polymerase sigma factor [Terracidiphilus sp.]
MGMEAANATESQRAARRGVQGNGYPPGGAQLPVLTAEQERVLLEHLPIVRFLARRIHERLPQHVEIEDLVSAGVVGLMDAFSKFDPAKKVQFRSYAQFRIRGAILDSLRTLDWSPRELRRKGRAVEEAIRVLTVKLGHAPNEAEVAGELALDLEEYQLLLGDLKGLEIGTLHMERNEDSGEEELAYVPGRPEEDLQLTAEGANRYLAPEGVKPLTATNAAIHQGAIEGANQDVIKGTMNLILVQREAEMMQRALTVFHTEFNKIATEDLPRV